jgi:hypothetical protein
MPDHPTDDPGPRHDRSPAAVSAAPPDLDRWLPAASLRVTARRESDAEPDRLWHAAQATPLTETGKLGRLIRWRIPGTTSQQTFGGLFREGPFLPLEEDDRHLISGLVGSIWTLRRDYPELVNPAAFEAFDQRGAARVAFGFWVQEGGRGRSALCCEARVEAIGLQGRFGVAAVRPLVQRFGHLVGSEGLAAAVRLAERDDRGE